MTSEEKNEKVNFYQNFKIYLEFLFKYKYGAIALVFIVLFIEALHVIDKYLFKIIIDGGSSFIAGTLEKSIFIHTLSIILFVFLGAAVFKAMSLS